MVTTPGLGVLVLEMTGDGGAQHQRAASEPARPARGATPRASDGAAFDGLADRDLIDVFAAIVPFERG